MATLRGGRSSFSPIGMDIGRRGVRLVQLTTLPRHAGTRLAGEWRLFKAVCWEWSTGRESSGTPESGGADGAASVAALRSDAGPGEFGRRLKRLLLQNEFRGKELVVGLSSPEVELHALELPVRGDGLHDTNLRQAAHWEIERLMSFTQGEVESDFWLLPAPNPGASGVKPERSGAQRPGQPTAIGVAAEKRSVSGVWKTCEAARVWCRRLDAGVCALSRFGSWLRGLPGAEDGADGHGDSQAAREIWGLLDLGHTHVRLVICTDDIPVLVRRLDAGGARWIGRVAEALGLSPAAAEIHLRDHGISIVGGMSRGRSDQDGRGLRRDDSASARATAAPSAQLGSIIRNILREELSALCGEIERSYRYVLQCYPDRRLSELLLVGGGAELRNLDEYLRLHLGIEVRSAAERLESTLMASSRHGGTGTPFIAAGVSGRYSVGALACAIGLAIPPTDG